MCSVALAQEFLLWWWWCYCCSKPAFISLRFICFMVVNWFMLVLAGGKAEALAGLGQGSLQPFHVDRFEPGHGATNFARWSTSNVTYDVSYSMVS